MKGAIIRCAALLVPEQQRAEWLAEWNAELWYAENVSVSTCFGAFQDAWWLRRSGPLPHSYGVLHLEAPAPPPQYFSDHHISLIASPGRCLAVLAALAVLAIGVAAVLPASREHIPFFDMLPMVCTSFLFARMTSSFSLGNYPKGSGLRRWLFLVAKVLLLFPICICVTALHPAMYSFGFVGGLFGMRWILEDQQQRCPTCLRLLGKPVRIGQASRIFLEWHGRELICLRGHGLLHVPEQPSIWHDHQRWTDLDPSWRGLFPSQER